MTYEIAPARSAAHLVVGLAAGGQYGVSAALRRWNKHWPDQKLLIAEEEFANEIVVTTSGDSVASPAGLLRFHR